MTFFASLAVAATQMLAPGWIWRQLQHILPPSLTTGVSAFWRPVVLHRDLYRARFNREIYTTNVTPDNAVWIGGEQGFLAFSKDRGETWKCYTFDARTGGFPTVHDCGQGSAVAGVVASGSRSLWPLSLPAVHAAQSTAVPSAPKSDVSQQKSDGSEDDLLILLSETSHSFGPVEVNTSKSWTLKVSGTPLTKPQNVSAALPSSTEGAGFRVLGTNQCRVGAGPSCSFSIEFLPQKVGPYQTTLILKSVEAQSNGQNAPRTREYVVSLIGSGQATVTPAQTPPAVKSVNKPFSAAGSTTSIAYTPGDVIYLDRAHLVMANGRQLQLLVRTAGEPVSWVRPGNLNTPLEDGTMFFGSASADASPSRYLADRKSCPAVVPGRSFVSMLNQMLLQLPSGTVGCGSIKNDAGTHLNALASGNGAASPATGPVWTGYAGGGRPGHGMVFRIEIDEAGHRTLTPLTHDAAADSLLLPIGMKLPPPWFYLVALLCLFLMWAVATRPSPVPAEQGIEAMAVNDRPLEPGDADAVRLRTVADGMSRFFRNPSTRAPLVLCINGNWGSGKSSLMNLLAGDLRNHYHTVIPFNAWHHQSEDQILASLLQAVRKNALRSPWTLAGAWTRVRIFLDRWPERWFVSVIFCLATVWTVLLANDFLKARTVDISKIAAFIPAFVTTLVTLRNILQGFTGFLANPASLLATNGKGSKGDLEEQTTLRQRFARDFGTVTRILGNGKLVLLIDDLDRCSPEKIRDIVEAINFLVTAGECYIVLGMARQVVEYYLGQSFTQAIKTMPASLLNLTDDEVKVEGKRESAFANIYLQKMIQLQFNLLPLTNDQAITLLQSGNHHDGSPGSPTTPDYISDTRSVLKWEDRLRSTQHTIQRWFLPLTGTLLLTLGALYSASLQNSANWVQQQVAPFLGKPIPRPPAAEECSTLTSCQQSLGAAKTSVSLTPQVSPAPEQTTHETSAKPADGNASPGRAAGTAAEPAGGDVTPLPLHDGNLPLPLADVQRMRTGPGVMQVLLLVMVLGGGMWLLAQWWLIARADAKNAQDSKEFLLALRDWAPALLAIYKTPRGLKQYLNNVRFLAMLQRSQIAPSQGKERQPLARRIALWIVARNDDEMKNGILRTIQAQARAGFSEDPSIPDELLVALAALSATSAVALETSSWLKSGNDFGTTGTNLSERIREALIATAQRRRGVAVHTVDQLRASLMKYQTAFGKLNGQTE